MSPTYAYISGIVLFIKNRANIKTHFVATIAFVGWIMSNVQTMGYNLFSINALAATLIRKCFIVQGAIMIVDEAKVYIHIIP